MGYGVPTTPFLDQLAAGSFIVPNAMVAGVPTYYSFPGIMASRYPLALGREVFGLAPRETSLASVLKDIGYRTAFFGAGNPYLSAQYGYDFGFDVFRDFANDCARVDSRAASPSGNKWTTKLNRRLANVSHRIPAASGAYDELYFRYCQRRVAASPASLDTLRRFPTADEIVNHAEAWIKSSADQPFFLWLHFMDPHAPYYPTDGALKMMEHGAMTASRARYLNAYWNRSNMASRRLAQYRKDILTIYDAGIRWVDTQLSRLVEGLRHAERWDDCIFAVTADHGEEFLDHGGRYHSPSLAEELIHVPLLIRVPGAVKNKVCGEPFSLLHLAPTLLGAAEAPVPVDFQGTNFYANLQNGVEWSPPAISECVADSANPLRVAHGCGSRQLAVREKQYKLVLTFDQQNQVFAESLFDLKTDPAEKKPLSANAKRPERRRLLRIALEHLQRPNPLRNSDAYFRARSHEIVRSVSLDWDTSSQHLIVPAFQAQLG
jgi:arylsulfatase A-like enzyme